MSPPFITIVSGLPRSGTSLMMQMLNEGGFPILTDGLRLPDADNPKGYFEIEAVKQLGVDASWLERACGKAFKAISMLLYDLPPEYNYRVIFMVRDIAEILASQKKMLLRRGGTFDANSKDSQMRVHFEAHLNKVKKWLDSQPNFRVHYCAFHNLFSDPIRAAEDISDFLGTELNLASMAAAVDSNLYRNRKE